MKTLLTAAAIAFVPVIALAGEVRTEGTKTIHGGVMTGAFGKTVPTMSSDAKPMEKSKAPERETYTDVVGRLIPTMTAPNGDVDMTETQDSSETTTQ